MNTGLKFDMAGFNQQVSQVQRLIGRNARSYVRTTARRLIRRLAFNTPRAPSKYGASGRLRAGFWPAAIALNISNIYTRQPNKNEGRAIDRTSAGHPSFTIINSVPYLGNLKGGLKFADIAINGVRAQMIRDLEKYARESWAKRGLIDNLSAN